MSLDVFESQNFGVGLMSIKMNHEFVAFSLERNVNQTKTKYSPFSTKMKSGEASWHFIFLDCLCQKQQ